MPPMASAHFPMSLIMSTESSNESRTSEPSSPRSDEQSVSNEDPNPSPPDARSDGSVSATPNESSSDEDSWQEDSSEENTGFNNRQVSVRLGMGVLICFITLITYLQSFGEVPFKDDLAILQEISYPQGGIKETMTARAILETGQPVYYGSMVANLTVISKPLTGLHVVNLILHIVVAIGLMQLVCMVLGSEEMPEFLQFNQEFIGGIVALVWAIHPLCTDAVTYVSHRDFVLVGLSLVYSTLCFAYALKSGNILLWMPLAIISLLVGLGSHPSAVCIPLVVLIFEQVFVRDVSPRVKGAHLLMHVVMWAITGAVFSWYFLGTNLELAETLQENVGLSALATQSEVTLHYMKLVVWPDPLCADYRWPTHSFRETLFPLLSVAILFGATLFTCLLVPRFGFLALMSWVLIGSAAVFDAGRTAAEYRVYSALIPVVAAVILGGTILLENVLAGAPAQFRRVMGYVLTAVIALPLATLTSFRNQDYLTRENFYTALLRVYPDHSEALAGLGTIEFDRQNFQEALAYSEQAVHFAEPNDPKRGEYLVQLARHRLQTGQTELATEAIEKAIRNRDWSTEEKVKLREQLATIYREVKNFEKAEQQYERILGYGDQLTAIYKGTIHQQLGDMYQKTKQFEEALEQHQTAIELLEYHQLSRDSRLAIGRIHLLLGDKEKAEIAFRDLLKLKPNDPEAIGPLTQILVARGDSQELRKLLETAFARTKNTADNVKTNLQLSRNYAWLLATSPDANVRDGGRALLVARDLSRFEQDNAEEISAQTYDVLAAALAETGNYETAEQAATAALRQLEEAGAQDGFFYKLVAARRELYRKGIPYREEGPTVERPVVLPPPPPMPARRDETPSEEADGEQQVTEEETVEDEVNGSE